MLFGLVLQAARRGSSGGVFAQQVITVPAAGISFARTISDEHPRRTWRESTFALDEKVWHMSGVKRAMRQPWTDRDRSDWHLTTDLPVALHITDDEYHELRTGVMARNVSLRAMRALEAHGAIVIGKDAQPLDDVFDRFENALGKPDSVLPRTDAGDGSIAARITDVLTKVDDTIRADKVNVMETYTPREARAKGGGVHRTHSTLPAAPSETSTTFSGPAPAAAPAPAPAPAPVSGEGVVKPGDVLMRPNGTPYIAREVEVGIKGLSDVEFVRRFLRRGVNVLADGPPGTGKTALFEVSAPGLRTMVLSASTEAADFYGGYISVWDAEQGKEVLVWQDSDLVKAMEEGTTLLVDELFLAPSPELAPLMPLLDGRRELRIPQNPARGTIKAKSSFHLVAAYNPSTARWVSEAMLSRFRKITVNSDYDVARQMGVNPRLVDAAEHLDSQRKLHGSWSPQVRECLAFKADEEDLGLQGALQLLINDAPEEERDMVESHLRERFGDMPGAARKIKRLEL